jgi:hypothetical protein
MFSSRLSTPGTVALTCNPIYSEEGDEEDLSLRPALAKSSQDPILRNKNLAS